MPLSIKYKCVFIHIPRTGGTSFRKILGIDGDGVETTDWSKASLEQVNGKGLLSISNREVTLPSHTIPRVLPVVSSRRSIMTNPAAAPSRSLNCATRSKNLASIWSPALFPPAPARRSPALPKN